MLFNWKLFPGTNLQDLNLDWIINFVKMIPSRLPKFSDHHTWLVYDYSTGEYYDSGEPTGGAGEPGEPGKSPIIGANGNWYTWNTTTEAYTDTGTRAQGIQGEPGAGVASGGVAGDVLVKASGVDYNTGWTSTPPQMGSIAHINAGNTADCTYNAGDYLVYNGQLYKVGVAPISQGVTLNPGEGGNISAVNVANELQTVSGKTPKLHFDNYLQTTGTFFSIPVSNRSNFLLMSFNRYGRFASVVAPYVVLISQNLGVQFPFGNETITIYGESGQIKIVPSNSDVTSLYMSVVEIIT